MFRFVADHVGGVGAKRKMTPRTCESCKKRHKRCHHKEFSESDASVNASRQSSFSGSPLETSPRNGAEAASGGQESPLANVSGSSAAANPVEDTETDSIGPNRRHPARDTYLRFVGDLSPEASFLASRNNQTGNTNISRHDYVGMWLDQKSDKTTHVGPPGMTQHRQLVPEPQGSRALLSSQALRPVFAQECLEVVPPDYEFSLLSSLYYAKINPFFPILHDEDLDQHGEMEVTALKQCICLVASLDPSLRKHLRLPHTEQVLTQIDFRDRIAAAVKQSLDMRLLTDHIVILQVCVLMAFYVAQSGYSEISTYYSAQAVHHSQTLGLHLGGPDEAVRSEKSKRIFWCVWVLDRLNAAANGRPILIHDRDMDQTILRAVNTQSPAFKLLIRVTRFLDETISFYRPLVSLPAKDAANDASFEEMVEETGALEVGNALLGEIELSLFELELHQQHNCCSSSPTKPFTDIPIASLQMFYLSVVILRSRPKRQQDIARTPGSELQMYCAANIVSIASEEFKSTITFWPVIPYAVSIATSIAYKTLRNSMMPSNRKRAYALFHGSCEVLDELSKAFVSARAIARLAMDTMQEMDRVTAGRRRTQLFQNGTESLEGTFPESDRRSMSTSHSQIHIQPISTTRHTNITANDAAQSSQTNHPPVPNNVFPVVDCNTFSQFEGEGVFTDFDPSFDLGRLDALFSANLDPTMPILSTDWLGAN